MKAKVVREIANDPEDIETYRISGSFASSLITASFIAYSARGNISTLSSPISAMTNLNQSLKGLLAISTLIPNVIYPIPMSWLVHRTGGKKEVLFMAGISLAGMTTLTILSACTDLRTIDHFDWRYGVMLTAGILTGHGAAAFQLMSDTLKWTPDKKNIPIIQAAYSFIVDSAHSTTPIIFLYLKPFGYWVPFTLFSGLLALVEIGVLRFFSPSPYNQYKTRFSQQRARELAQEAGEIEGLIGTYDNITIINFLKNNIRIIWDRRSILLSFSLLASLGNSWVTRLILPNALASGFGFTQSEAIITSSLSFLLAISSRPIASVMIAKWDEQSGGVKIHLLGCIATIAGGIALTRDLPRWGLYSSLAAFNIGYGFNMVTPLNIAVAWSKPNNQRLNEINPSILFALFNSFGALGGILLPVILGLMVDEGSSRGYQNYFFVIISIMVVSAVCVPIIDYQVRGRAGNVAQNPISFFGGGRTIGSDPDMEANAIGLTKRSAAPIDVDEAPEVEAPVERKYYVDMMI